MAIPVGLVMPSAALLWGILWSCAPVCTSAVCLQVLPCLVFTLDWNSWGCVCTGELEDLYNLCLLEA